MADLAQQISEARKNGYSDEEIVNHLGQTNPDLAPKIKAAQGEGYGSSDIVTHLSGGVTMNPATNVLDDPGNQYLYTTPEGIRVYGKPATVQPEGSAAERFAKGLWSTTGGGAIDTLKTMYKMAALPFVYGPGVLQGLTRGHIDQAQKTAASAGKAIDAIKRGNIAEALNNYTEAFGHGLATVAPLVGPAAASAAEQMAGEEGTFDKYGNVVTPGRAPDIAGGLGAGTGLIGSTLAGPAISKGLGKGVAAVAEQPLFKSRLNPVEQAAVNYARQQNIPLSPGTITGSKYLQSQEALTQARPFGSPAGREFRLSTEAGLRRVAEELPEQVKPGVAVTPESAGEAVQGQVTKQVELARAKANEAYGDFQKAVRDPSAARTVPQQLSDGTQVDQNIQAPVDMRGIKAALEPQYHSMSKWMQPALRNASAGFTAIKSILEGPNFLPAEEAEHGLSGLKDLSRGGDVAGADPSLHAALRDINQGIGAHATKLLQEQIDAAVAEAGGPGALEALQRGRAATAGKIEIGELAQKLRDEPVQTFKQLTWQHDTGIDFLRKIAEQAPDAMPAIGRAWVQQAMDRAMREGGFSSTKGLLNDFRNLGPETQKILFPDPEVRANLGNFFKVADMASYAPNPSGTAVVGAANTLNPLKIALGYIGSKALFTPKGISLLTDAIRPQGPGATAFAMAKVRAAAGRQPPGPGEGGPGGPATPPSSPPPGGGGGGTPPPSSSGPNPTEPGMLEAYPELVNPPEEQFGPPSWRERLSSYFSSERGALSRRKSTDPIADVALKYLMENPLELGGGGKTVDMGRALRQTVRSAGGYLAPGSESALRAGRAESAMLADLEYALASQPEARKWYTGSVKEMEDQLVANRPEFKDPAKLSLFKYLLGVTSNGVDPLTNFDAAVRGWDLYNQHGRFMAYDPGRTSDLSRSGKVGLTFRANSYETAMGLLDRLVQEKGEAGATEWLRTKHPIQELKQYDPGITVGDKSPRLGAYILGEKVGSFGSNLNGIYSELTADKWWSRTWNRWMGTNIATDAEGKFKVDKEGSPLMQDDPRNETERNLMRQTAANVAAKLNLTVAELQAVLWYAEQALYREHGLPAASADYSQAAKKFFSKQRGPASSPGTGPLSAPSPPSSGIPPGYPP